MPINFSHPTFWGPLVWNLLHLLASQFKSTAIEDRQDWVEVLNHLPGILPCKECREHFRTYLKENPIDINTVANAYSLSLYLWKAHEHVNGLTGKKSRVTFAMLTKQLGITVPQTPLYSQPSIPSLPSLPAPPSLPAQQLQLALPSQQTQQHPKQPNFQHIRIYQSTPLNQQPNKPKSSGKPALRVVKPQPPAPAPAPIPKHTKPNVTSSAIVLNNTSIPQKQAPRAPKAVPLHVQKIIQAKKSLEGQLQINSEVKSILAAPIPRPDQKIIAITRHPSVQNQSPKPRPQTNLLKPYLFPHAQSFHKVNEGDVKRSLSALMNSEGKRMPSRVIVPTAQQRNTIDKMAEMLQRSGVKIRGNAPSGPTVHIQPGIQPVVPKSVIESRAQPLALPAPLSVPRALTQSTPTRKKCNCSRK